MQYNRGMAKILIIVTSVLFLSAIISAILYFGKEEVIDEITVDDAVKVISLDERAGGINAENLIITDSVPGFARGKLTDVLTGEEKDFYLIKIGDNWRVVEVSNQPVSCERFARLGFPNILIKDCKLTFSDAVTLSEIDATLDDFFKNSSNFSLKIIATVESVEETEDGQIVTIDSGGEIIEIILSNNDPAVEVGDLIVTNITAPNSRSENNNVVYQTNNSVVVNESDRDLFVEQTNNQSTITSPINTTENKIFKINAPRTSAPPAYFKNIYDVDNSYVDVELDGSF